MQIDAFFPAPPITASEHGNAANFRSDNGNRNALAAARMLDGIANERPANEANAASSRPGEPASVFQDTPKVWAAAVIAYLKQAGVHDEAIHNYKTVHAELDHTQAATKFEQDIQDIMPAPACSPTHSDRTKDRSDQRQALLALLKKYGVMEAAGKKLAPQMAQKLKNQNLYEYILDQYQIWHPDLTRQEATARYLEGEGQHEFWSRLLAKVDTPYRQTVWLICRINASVAEHIRQRGESGTAVVATRV